MPSLAGTNTSSSTSGPKSRLKSKSPAQQQPRRTPQLSGYFPQHLFILEFDLLAKFAKLEDAVLFPFNKRLYIGQIFASTHDAKRHLMFLGSNEHHYVPGSKSIEPLFSRTRNSVSELWQTLQNAKNDRFAVLNSSRRYLLGLRNTTNACLNLLANGSLDDAHANPNALGSPHSTEMMALTYNVVNKTNHSPDAFRSLLMSSKDVQNSYREDVYRFDEAARAQVQSCWTTEGRVSTKSKVFQSANFFMNSGKYEEAIGYFDQYAFFDWADAAMGRIESRVVLSEICHAQRDTSRECRLLDKAQRICLEALQIMFDFDFFVQLSDILFRKKEIRKLDGSEGDLLNRLLVYLSGYMIHPSLAELRIRDSECILTATLRLMKTMGETKDQEFILRLHARFMNQIGIFQNIHAKSKEYPTQYVTNIIKQEELFIAPYIRMHTYVPPSPNPNQPKPNRPPPPSLPPPLQRVSPPMAPILEKRPRANGDTEDEPPRKRMRMSPDHNKMNGMNGVNGISRRPRTSNDMKMPDTAMDIDTNRDQGAVMMRKKIMDLEKENRDLRSKLMLLHEKYEVERKFREEITPFIKQMNDVVAKTRNAL